MADLCVLVFKPPHAPELGDQSTPKRLGPALLTVKWRCLQWGGRVVALTVGWFERRSPATVDGGPCLEQVPFDSTIVMVLSVRDESGRILKHAFRGKLSKL